MEKGLSLFILGCALTSTMLYAQSSTKTIQAYTGEELSGVVYGVSSNGKYAVGFDGVLTETAFVWDNETKKFQDVVGVDPEGKEEFPHAELYDVADDGTAVGIFYDGEITLENGLAPYLPGTYKNGVWTRLPLLDGMEIRYSYLNGYATAISNDGHVIAGIMPIEGRGTPVLWIDGVIQRIDDIKYMGQGTWIEDVSNDGRILCGMAEWHDGSRSPAVWIDGTMVRLEGFIAATDDPDCDYFFDGRVTRISSDGKRVVGWYDPEGSGYTATGFYWDIPEVLDINNIPKITPIEGGYIPSCIGKSGRIYTGSAYGVAGIWENSENKTIFDYYEVDSAPVVPTAILNVSDDECILGGTYLISNTMGTYNAPVVLAIEDNASHVSSLSQNGITVSLDNSILNINGEYNSLEIYNPTGSCVLQNAEATPTINVACLPKGIYFVKIDQSNSTSVFKIYK